MINPEYINKIINNLDTSKTTQQGDIPTKIIKDNKEIFSYFISTSFNNAVNKGFFPDELKYADIKPIYKKELRNEKENYKRVIILPNLSKSLNVVRMINLKITLIGYCQNISADLEKDLAHNTAY